MAMDSGNNNNIQSSTAAVHAFGSFPHDSAAVSPFSSTHFNNPPAFFEPSSSRSILTTQGLGQVPITSSSTMQPGLVDDINGVSVTKNPKKRTRASRKAPTTVLTTDTTNFRAMVQEFTGIPAPPFSTTSSSFSPWLHLFGSGHLEAWPNKRVQPASTQLLNNTSSVPLVEASNVLNLQHQMVQGTSLSASTMAFPDEFGLSHHFNGGEDHLIRPFDGIYCNGHNINT